MKRLAILSFTFFLLVNSLQLRAARAALHSATCIDPAEDADVIFRAKAVETHGANTEMEVLEVIKGSLSKGSITFKHQIKPEGADIDVGREYYTLSSGHIYLINAKLTNEKNVLSQLYGSDYCSKSVKGE